MKHTWGQSWVVILLFLGISSCQTQEKSVEHTEKPENVREKYSWEPQVKTSNFSSYEPAENFLWKTSKGTGPAEFTRFTFDEPVFVKSLKCVWGSNGELMMPVKIDVKVNDTLIGSFPAQKEVSINKKVSSLRILVRTTEGMQMVYLSKPANTAVVYFDEEKSVGLEKIWLSDTTGKSVFIRSVVYNKPEPTISIFESKLNRWVGNISDLKTDSSRILDFEMSYSPDDVELSTAIIMRSNGTMTYLDSVGLYQTVQMTPSKAGFETSAGPAIVTRKLMKFNNQKIWLPAVMQYFVNMEKYNADFVVDMKYGQEDNLFGEDVYGCQQCYLRKDAAEALLKVQASFQKKGYRIKFFDCYRPYDIQVKMWEKYPHPGYVANPYEKGSMHNRGAAVDMTLVDSLGVELDMGTGFDFFGKKAHHTFTDLPKEVLSNRALLKSTMEANGFRSIRTEWWHYSLVQPGGHTIANAPICQ